MGLFQPKWMSKNRDTALAFVDKLQDEEKLCLAATRSPHEEVRLAAAKKLKTDDAILWVLSNTRVTGQEKELLTKELVENLQDKGRLKDSLNDSAFVVKYYAIKYTSSEEQAFELLKHASDQGKDLSIEAYADDLSADQCYSLLRTSKCKGSGRKFTDVLFDQMKKSLPDKETFEEMLCDLALHAESLDIRNASKSKLSLPHIQQRYHNAVQARRLREQAKAEEANRIAREEEEKRQKLAREKEETEKRNKLLTNKERFFRGEELFWMDERDVLKSLTTDEIKAHGLSIPFFEKLYKYYDLASFKDLVLIPCADEKIMNYLISCLDDRSKHSPQKMGDRASTAARLLAYLYQSGRFTEEIKKHTGKILQNVGEMPVFDMSDPLERDMAIGYHADPEIRFDPEENIGLKYFF